MKQTQRKVAIIGAGITGLVIAFQLKKKGIPFTVFEKKNRSGGVIHTLSKEGFVYETGPVSGVISNPETASFFESIRDHIVPEAAGEAVRARLILKNGKWHPLPSGPLTAVTTPLFSISDKFRILLEPFRTRGDDPDETVAKMVKRRLGKSFLDYAVDPFISGIYAGNPENLVTRHALPKLYDLEQRYGSFIRGAARLKKERKGDVHWEKVTKQIFSFPGGLGSLTKRITQLAGEENFVYGTDDLTVEREKSGAYTVFTRGNSYSFTDVISTVPAPAIEQVFPFLDPKDTERINSLRYAAVAHVSVGFRKWDGIPLDAFGGLIPVREKRDILGVLFVSSLFNHRAPEGGALLSIFLGGTRRPQLAASDPEHIEKCVAQEFRSLMGIHRFSPDLFEVTRHPLAIAQYGTDTAERLEAIDRIEQVNKGLILAGSIRDGIGMADRIKQAFLVTENF